MAPFRRLAGGLLAAEVDGYCLQVRAPVQAGGQWAYTVLRRQYGRGSLLALVGQGRAPTLADAVDAAERLAPLIVPGGMPAATESDTGPSGAMLGVRRGNTRRRPGAN